MISNTVFKNKFFPIYAYLLLQICEGTTFLTQYAAYTSWCIILRVQGKNIILWKTCYFVSLVLSRRSNKLVFSGCIPVSRYFSGTTATPLTLPFHMSFPFQLPHPSRKIFPAFFNLSLKSIPRGQLTTDCLKFASGNHSTRMFDYLV